MKKSLKKLMAVLTAMSMSLSLFSFQALAAETNGTTEVESLPGGGKEVVDVIISIDGETTTTETAEGGDETESGANVKYESTETKDAEGNVINGQSSYDVANGTYGAQGGSEITTGQGGISDSDGIKVNVSLTAGGKDTATGNASQEPVVSGDTKESDEDGEYNYTSTTVKEQGSVTVTTKDVTVQDIVDVDNDENGKSDLTHVNSSTKPTASNEMYVETPTAAPEQYMPGNAPAEGDEYQFRSDSNYQFEFVGTGNNSFFRPAMVFTKPLTDEQKLEQYGNNFYNGAYIVDGYYTSTFVKWLDAEYRNTLAKNEDGSYVCDEQGYLLDKEGNRVLKNEQTMVGPDGKTYYLHRFDANGAANNVEGWFWDGEWVKELNSSTKYGAVWAGAQQLILVDKETGKAITAYNADITVKTRGGFGYNIENLEDSAYFSDEMAAQIRTIAANGYWGTETNEAGSLDAMKQMLLNAVDENGNKIFTEDELASLNDGVALTATQMAIWACSNEKDGVEFVNNHYVTNGGNGNVPKDKEAETKLVFKIYDYLLNLDPTAIENPTTADTIINADNFLKDMSITVIEKAMDHENNKNESNEDDAYVTDLSFALVVTPSTENGDDLVVKVVDPYGNVLASGRIAGENKEGETYDKLMADENGNYTLCGITMIEGNTNFNITLEGIQNLKEGVYLYTSEIETADPATTDDDYRSPSAVAIASGKHEVGVSMNIAIELSVEDEIVVTEHVWRSEWTSSGNGGGNVGGNDGDNGDVNGGDNVGSNDGDNGDVNGDDSVIITEDSVPLAPMPEIESEVEPEAELEEILDGEVPMAVVPKTGDASALWMLMSVLSGTGLAGVSILGRKKRED